MSTGTDTRRKSEIAAAFGAAAAQYESGAQIQRTVARHLAALCSRERLPAQPRILEIGCGTGFLTRELRTQWPDATLIATDIADAMLEETAKLGVASQVHAMDGEHPTFEGPWFDLIVSSLTVQWFSDLPAGLTRLTALLRPNGSLYFSTMGRKSFSAWREAHERCGESAGLADYPDLCQLQSMLLGYADAFACDEEHAMPDRGGLALLRHFRGIGAQVPRPGYRPLGGPAMRRVIRAYDEVGGQTAYHVLYGRITHAG